MNYFIPTYQEALNITQTSEVFYVKHFDITVNSIDYNVAIFNYRLASYDDFKLNNAYELRGLTYIKPINSYDWKCFPALQKFFNINENYDWQENDLMKYEIISLQYKEDGSLIQPILFDNTILLKTKALFDNEQALMAQKFLNENTNYQDFIHYCFSINVIPLFELVSPFNQIVLQYHETSLVLLQIRDKRTGDYVSMDVMNQLAKEYSINMDKFLDVVSLKELITLKETMVGIEGWVVQLSNKQFCKIKTDDYFYKHGLITEDKEMNLVPLILDEKMDDLLAQLQDGSEKKAFFLRTMDLVNHFYNHTLNFALKFETIYETKIGTKKELSFYIRDNGLKDTIISPLLFYTCGLMVENKEEIISKLVKELILKNCNKQERCLEFLYKDIPLLMVKMDKVVESS